MSLTDDFEKVKNDQGAYKEKADVLRVKSSYNIYHYYNFTLRIMTTNHEKSMTTLPFSKLDPEVLEILRDQLIKMGGTPPALSNANGFGKKAMSPGISRNNGGQK